MPLIKLVSSAPVDEERSRAIAAALSEIAARVIGKPEAYVMASMSESTIAMAGTPDPAAFVEVRSIGGLDPEVNAALSAEVCTLLGAELGIESDRIYLNFLDIARTDWGWKGRTFG